MIKINVTNIVKYVKEHNLLFYPLIVYILTKALHENMGKSITPAYLSVSEDGFLSMLYQDYKPDFEDFFRDYVENCYQYQASTNFVPQGNVKSDTVLFSYLPQSAVKDKLKKEFPIFLISPLEEKDGLFSLNINAINIDVDANFSTICEQLCGVF